MFITLLLVTFIIATCVSFIVARVFASPIRNILDRIISDAISKAWSRYISFALYVVGISSGVRIWDLEKYITADQHARKGQIVDLTVNRWVFEVYRTIIGTLQGIAWTLLVFFVIALIAFVIVRSVEYRRKQAS
jgi:ABC-type xylose transport system permease subunit